VTAFEEPPIRSAGTTQRRADITGTGEHTLRRLGPGGSAAPTGICVIEPDEAVDRHSPGCPWCHHAGATWCRESRYGTIPAPTSAEAG
jgi:hypothetical protein